MYVVLKPINAKNCNFRTLVYLSFVTHKTFECHSLLLFLMKAEYVHRILHALETELGPDRRLRLQLVLLTTFPHTGSY